jgi:dTMP kinase
VYISIEGVDKVGKTTLYHKLAVNFEDKYISKFIREPKYKLCVGNYINDAIGSPKEKEIQALAFALDRLKNYEIAMNAKYSPVLLISDRSKFSSYAYQGEEVYAYNMLINKHMPDPDVIVYLYCSFEEIEEMFDKDDIFENRKFLEKVHKFYLGPIKQYCQRNNIEFVSFDSRGDSYPQNVLDYIESKMEERK